MKIDLTPEQNDIVRHAMATGRIRAPEDAVQEALALWIERERRRLELVSSLDAAEASLAHGEGRVITRESMQELAEDVKRRGREHVTARTAAPR